MSNISKLQLTKSTTHSLTIGPARFVSAAGMRVVCVPPGLLCFVPAIVSVMQRTIPERLLSALIIEDTFKIEVLNGSWLKNVVYHGSV